MNRTELLLLKVYIKIRSYITLISFCLHQLFILGHSYIILIIFFPSRTTDIIESFLSSLSLEQSQTVVNHVFQLF